jgi:thiol-disulfide isomerase/thioredoxin
VRRALTALAACLVLASCTTDQPSPGSGVAATEVSQSRVDVDTPALRTLKAEAGVEPCAPSTGTSGSSGLPQVKLPCLGGGPAVDLAKLQGPMVVNLFAQWCGPCRTELPYFQRLHRTASVEVLGVDYLDTQPGQALRLVRRTGVTYPLVADPAGALRSDLRIRGLPGVVLLDADGKVVDVEFRVFGSYAELRTFVEKGLKVTLPS